jgi:hypothetical protein
MEKSEQEFIVKFFFLKCFDSKVIHRKLTDVLGHTAYSIIQIKGWCARFKAGDLPCEDKSRPGSPPHVLGRPSPISLRIFLLRLQNLLRNTSISRSRQSKRSSNKSFGSRGSPEGEYHIRSPILKMWIGKQWQLTCWASSIAKRAILFLELWQKMSLSFFPCTSLTISSQPAEMM